MENKRKITSYRDLEVWRKGIALVKKVYLMTNSYPSSEQFGVTSQIRRSAASVPANIAEGWGRESSKNYIQFLKTSRGSLYEVDTFIEISLQLDFIDKIEYLNVREDIEELSKMLNSLIKKISQSI
jgi:four helix bundle protein